MFVWKFRVPEFLHADRLLRKEDDATAFCSDMQGLCVKIPR